MANNRPTKTLKLLGVEIAKWEKTNAEGKTFQSFTFQKNYKDKNGNWQNTTFFNLYDLPILATLILLVAGKSAKVQTPSANTQVENSGANAEESEEVPF